MSTDAGRAQTNGRRSSKSRSGCKRCKIRRRKCDETRPSCLQCKSKNLECPGYPPLTFRWSSKHEKVHTAESTSRSSSIMYQEESDSLSCRSPTKLAEDAYPTFNEFQAAAPILQPSSAHIAGSSDRVEPAHGERPAEILAEFYLEEGSNSAAEQNQEPDYITPLHSNSSPSAPGNLDVIRRRIGNPSVPRFLVHVPTMLIDQYFDSVCNIFSLFDNSKNPFRSSVESLWHSWAPMYYTMQSMAAAHLGNDFPQMRSVALQLQSEAYTCLQNTVPEGQPLFANDRVLLTVIMLGLTTAWHRTEDLGLSHQRAAKRLFQEKLCLQGPVTDPRMLRQNQFYEQCILYWEMLTAMMGDQDMEFIQSRYGNLEPSHSSAGSPTASTQFLRFPHPWTGINPQIVCMFARTGRLVRQARKINAASTSWEMSFDDVLDFVPLPNLTDIQEQVLDLEEELLQFSSPHIDDLVETGDSRTPLAHLLLMNEAYRCASLLLIYRVFPGILHRRLPSPLTSVEGWNSSYLQELSDAMSFSSPDFDDQKWLSSLAIYVLNILQKIPSSSGTRFLQPLVILVAASELRFPTLDHRNSLLFGPTAPDLKMEHIDIAQARRFAMERLYEQQLILAEKPYERVRMIIKETWSRLDAGLDAFWMDVMTEKHWETVAG